MDREGSGGLQVAGCRLQVKVADADAGFWDGVRVLGMGLCEGGEGRKGDKRGGEQKREVKEGRRAEQREGDYASREVGDEV
jgi:hypothetical protein